MSEHLLVSVKLICRKCKGSCFTNHEENVRNNKDYSEFPSEEILDKVLGKEAKLEPI